MILLTLQLAWAGAGVEALVVNASLFGALPVGHDQVGAARVINYTRNHVSYDL